MSSNDTLAQSPSSTPKASARATIRELLAHGLALLALFGSFLPLADWYYTTEPPAGFDLLHMVTYVSYLKEHLVFPLSMWKYTWFAGAPYSQDNPMLHMYVALPLANLLGDLRGTQVYLLITVFLMALFSYLSFWEISKRKILSLALAGAGIWSPAILFNFTRDGWATFSATMMFMPLVLWLLIRYTNRGQPWQLLLACVLSGVGFWGHPATSILMFLFLCIVLLLRPTYQGISDKPGRFGATFLFGIVTVAVGALPLYGSMANFFVGVAAHAAPTAPLVTYTDAPIMLVLRTNPFVWVLLGLAVVLAVLQRRSLWKGIALPFWGASIGLFILQISYIVGRNPLQVLGHPGRTWWMAPLLIGCLVSAVVQLKPSSHSSKGNNSSWSSRAIWWLIPVAILAVALVLRPMDYIEEMTMRMSQTVSDALLKGERDKATRIAPSGMDTQSLNQRVWIGEDYTAIWWNIFFPMPDARGYFHPIFTLDWSFWREASIRTSISAKPAGDLKWPAPLARNYALFLLDWYAISYVADDTPPAKDLLDNGIAVRHEKTYLDFTEMARKPTILQATNAPTILVVSNKSGYDVVLRNLAMTDKNSQRCIPIRSPHRLSAISDDELKSFDAVILYGYDFTKESSDLTRLARFVSEGGNLFIDAPSGVGDLSSVLPDPLPITTATTASPKDDWQFSSPDPGFFKGIDLKAFSPPIYDGGGWGVTLAPGEGTVKPWAKAVLNQAGNPVIVAGNLGKGKVIWSGLNLFYHSQQYNNLEEGKLVANFLDFIAPFTPSTSEFQAKRLAPERAEVEGKDFKGVLFKENFYSGWSATLATPQGTRYLRVYPAGPDLMYVRLPSKSPSLAKVTFSFGGPPFDWFLFALGPIFVLLALDIAVLEGRLFLGKPRSLLSNMLRSLSGRYRQWWTEE